MCFINHGKQTYLMLNESLSLYTIYKTKAFYNIWNNNILLSDFTTFVKIPKWSKFHAIFEFTVINKVLTFFLSFKVAGTRINFLSLMRKTSCSCEYNKENNKIETLIQKDVAAVLNVLQKLKNRMNKNVTHFTRTSLAFIIT